MRKAVMLGCAIGCLWAAPAFAATGLVADWHFDEGYGTTVHDSSGYHNDGQLSGGTAWVAGRNGGGAVQFDGDTGVVTVPDSPSLEPANAVSVAAWARATNPGLFRHIVAKGAATCNAASYGLYTGPNGGIAFYVSQNSGSTYTLSPDGGTGVWDGRWHYFVGTYDGSAVRLYVDGKQVGSGTPASGPIGYQLPTSNNLLGGNYAGCSEHGFPGAIDQASIWSKALSASEVQTAMTCSNYGDPNSICVVVKL
jgi:hypothetical protein